MLSYEDAMINVKTGGEFLDEQYGPDWVNRINLDSLILSHNCSCILGQLNGTDDGYLRECDNLGLNRYGGSVIDLGFYLPAPEILTDSTYDYNIQMREYNRDYRTLTQAWKDYVTERRS